MAEPKKPVDPQKEIEILVGELEERVDRLRAMYEQYFMGYEKIEPGVARKDVDRRFTHLRKTQIRNTALRFRFNVVTQKMNTYSMYWTRICRQIEEGTFKRHIQKANKRFAPGQREREQDFSIDVELGDFEDMMGADGELDMDKVLAENNAKTDPPEPIEYEVTQKSNLGYERDDTAKNKVELLVTEAPLAPKVMPRPSPTRQPSPAFAETDNADTVPPPPSTGSPITSPRVARHVVLPAGVKQRMLVKKGPSSSTPVSSTPTSSQQPPSGAKTEPPSAPEMTPAPMAAGIRGRMPSAPDRAPPSTSVIRAAQAQSQPHVHRSPPGLVRPGVSPNAQSVQRVQVAKPHDTQPPSRSSTKPPPSLPSQVSANRIPAAPAVPGASANRVPVAQPAASANRVPAAQPAASANRVPAAAPAASANRTPAMPFVPPGSVNRVPAAAATPAAPKPVPAPPPSVARTPIGLPSGQSVGRMPVSAGSRPSTMPPPAAQAPAAPRPAAPAPSERKLPIPPPSQRAIPVRPGGPMPAATPVRAPAPSVPDMEKSPPSRRPPPMLPSQVKKG